MVDQGNFEIPSRGLKARRSASELPVHKFSRAYLTFQLYPQASYLILTTYVVESVKLGCRYWCSQSDSNRQLPDFKSGDSTKLAYESVNMVVLSGIEPKSFGYQPSALPLSYSTSSTKKMVHRGNFEIP